MHFEVSVLQKWTEKFCFFKLGTYIDLIPYCIEISYKSLTYRKIDQVNSGLDSLRSHMTVGSCFTQF